MNVTDNLDVTYVHESNDNIDESDSNVVVPSRPSRNTRKPKWMEDYVTG